MRVGQVRHVAERVKFFCLFGRKRPNATAVKRRAFAHGRRHRQQQTDRVIAFFRGLRSGFAGE
jgi:hypothetical protein